MFFDCVSDALDNGGQISLERLECSTDGVDFSQMRVCHMYAAADKISFGIYACSPEESSFTAVFSDMKITECMWKAHDGQKFYAAGLDKKARLLQLEHSDLAFLEGNHLTVLPGEVYNCTLAGTKTINGTVRPCGRESRKWVECAVRAAV